MSPDEIEKLYDEMRDLLVHVATSKKTISYQELSRKISSELSASSFVFWNILGRISADEDDAGRGMLSAVVIGETGGPGKAFYKLALELGRDASDPLKFWLEELEFVHAFWGQKKESA